MIIEDASILRIIRDGGKIHRAIIDALFASGLLTIGHTGLEVEEWIIRAQKEHGVESAFLGQYGFPANIILSIDDVVVHGVPRDIPFVPGNVVKVDYGVRHRGYLTDAATTIIIGEPTDSRHQICIDSTKRALEKGVSEARAGNFTGDIGEAIERSITSDGFYIIRTLSGHGLGKQIHEKPDIQNFGTRGKGVRLKEGMYIAIEPIVGFTTGDIYDTGKFAICMEDGNIGVQEEHCGIVTREGFEIIV